MPNYITNASIMTIQIAFHFDMFSRASHQLS